MTVMGKDDWFRNNKWSPQIEAHFNEKLHRARDKKQYLRIQANYLTDQYPEVALKLLDRYFELGEQFDLASAYLSQARAFLSLGKDQEAIASFQKALQRERVYPNVQTQAWSEYALLVATKRLSHLYQDVLSVLEQHPPNSTSFPVDAFLWFVAHALICDALGNREYARESATKAVEYSTKAHSGFRYHPKVGLVGKEYEGLVKRMHALKE